MPPWPIAPNGEGPTLELVDPMEDNSIAQNWTASEDIGGTPGKVNSILSKIRLDNNNLPQAYFLYNNYPNPFNPTTVISWQIPGESQVDLTIYNILGEKLATLVSEKQKAGQYKIEFNAANLPSGIYFYRLHAGDYQQVKKMVVIK
jgi:hypothetical protein